MKTTSSVPYSLSLSLSLSLSPFQGEPIMQAIWNQKKKPTFTLLSIVK
jgi:hypothetical protein